MKFFFCLLILLVFSKSFSQSNFVRPSISLIEIVNQGTSPILNLNPNEVPNLFDYNFINTKEIKKQISDVINRNTVIDIVESSNVASEAILSVLPIKNGKFSNEIIKKRGMHSATDAQINALKDSQNEDFINLADNFGDIGVKQLDKINLLIFNVVDYTEKDTSEYSSCEGTVNFFFIKLDNGLNAYHKFKKNPDSLKTSRWSGIVKQQGSFSIISESSANEKGYKIPFSTLRENFSRDAQQKTYSILIRTVEDIQPKSTVIINSENKISSKIGSKEGLSIDNRFFAYEKQLKRIEKDDKTKDTIILKQRSQLRIKSVGQNKGIADGDSEATIFYKIAGRRVTDGMILIQKEDIGIGIFVGYGTMQWVRIDYRIKGISPGVKVFFGINNMNTWFGDITLNTDVIKKKLELPLSTVINKDVPYTSYSFEVGIEKSLLVNSRIQLIPFFGIGYTLTKIKNGLFFNSKNLNYNFKNNSSFFKGISLEPGLRCALNISGKLSIVGSTGFSVSINTYKDLEYHASGSSSTKYLLGGDSKSSDFNLLEFYSNVVKEKPTELKGVRWDIGIRYEF